MAVKFICCYFLLYIAKSDLQWILSYLRSEKSRVRDLLQSFGWILKEEKVGLQQSEACIFFAMHGMEKDMVFKGSLKEKYSSMDVEIWLGSTDIKF